MQLHATLGASVLACTAGDGHNGITRVVKGTLDSNLSILEPQRPETLPALPGDYSNTVALIGANLCFVGRVKNRVGKRQQIADRVAFGTEIERGIGVRVLDQL